MRLLVPVRRKYCFTRGVRGVHATSKGSERYSTPLTPLACSMNVPMLAHHRHRRFGCTLQLRILLFRQRTCPGSAKQWQYPTVCTVVASDAPGQYQEQCQPTDNRVDADRASQHEVQVHEQAEEGSDTGQDTEDQAETDQDFTKGDDIRESRSYR